MFLVVGSICFLFSYAVSSATIYGEDVNVLNGQQIEMPIYISNNPGLMGFSLQIGYDPDFLTPLSVEKGEVTNTGNFNDSIETSKTNRFDIFWSGSENVSDNGVVAKVYFLAKQPVSSTQITINYSQDDTFDENWSDVILNCQNATISIQGSDETTARGYIEGPCISGEKSYGIIDVNNCSDEEYELCLYLPENVASVERVFSDDANAFFTTENDFTKIIVNNISNSTNSFKLNLELRISDSYTSSGNYEIKSNDNTIGLFVISASSVGESTLIYSNTVFGVEGQIIDIPIYLKNGVGLMGYRLNFKYDDSIIEPVSATNQTSIGGNLDNDIGQNNDRFSVIWSNSDSISDNEQLLLLKVKMLRTSNTVIEVSYSEEDTFDENWNEVELICLPIYIIGDTECSHSNSYDVIGKAATCKETGLTDGKYCPDCETWIIEQEVIDIDSTNHADYGTKVENAKAATCTEDGYTGDTICKGCGAVLETGNTLPLAPHNYVEVVTPPTSTTQGFTTYTCSVCGDSYIDNFTPITPEADAKAIVSESTVRPGENVTVYISLDKELDVKSMSVSDIRYDKSKLSLNKGEWAVSGALLTHWDQNNEVGVITFSENTELSGNVFALTFNALDDLEDCEVEISCKLGVSTMDSNNSENQLNIENIPGKITITNVIRGDVNGDNQVNSNDAIYLLYHTQLPDRYPINQNGDFNGDGQVNSNDAIYLLYHTQLPDRYPLS